MAHIDFDHTGDSAQFGEFAYEPATKRVYTTSDQDHRMQWYHYDQRLGNFDTLWVAGGRGEFRKFDLYGRDSAVRATGTSIATTLYDAMNRPTYSYDSAGSAPMIMRYDAISDTSLTDRNSNTYRTIRNALGWVTQTCDASSNCSSYRYDANGALTSWTNRRGQRVDITRDALGRVTAKSGANTTSDSFSYASNGHDYTASNSVETDSMFVSPGSETAAISDSTVVRLAGMRFNIRHTYRRGMSGVDSTIITPASGSPLQFYPRAAVYDSVGELQTVQVGSSHPIVMNHTASGTLSRLRFTNVDDNYETTAFHATRRRTTTSARLDSIIHRSYHYDSVARIDQTVDSVKDRQWLYTYDKLGQLAQRDIRSSCSLSSSDSLSDDGSGLGYSCSTLISRDTISYDAMGNRTDHGSVPTTGNRYSSFNGATITYDADGNVTEKNKSGVYDRLLYWSAESRLDSANHEGDMVRYDYNALGKPVIKYRRGTTSSWYAYSYYIWDGDQLLIELDLNKNRNADFVYYPGTIDQPIAHGIGDSTVTAIRDFRSDAEGNTLATVVDGDYIQSQDTYDAWGTPAHDGQLNSALFWKGLKWEGDAVNLYFVRNRWYDPELGRFANEDPIGHAGGENLYSYGDNDPINTSDPSGLSRDGCLTKWIEFGSSNGQTTHAYSYEFCRGGAGGGTDNGTPRGFSVPSDLGADGGGGDGPGGRSELLSRVRDESRMTCFDRETRTRYFAVKNTLGAVGTFAGKAALGMIANRITNTTGLAGLAVRNFGSTLRDLTRPMLTPSELVPRGAVLFGSEVSGSALLGYGAWAYAQGAAIGAAFNIGVGVGSMAGAVGACF